MLELIFGVLFAAGAILFVLRPVFRPEAAGSEHREGRSGVDEGEDPEDDLSPRAVALRALKEIEFDRATGKLSDADYDLLKRRYTTEALAALRTEGEPREGPVAAARRAPAVAGPSRIPVAAAVCPTHGPRPESDAQFCSECGRRLATAPGYCARCGTALEREATYCHACGARVAA
ncbi:MAG: double zinc ribbon domain-containing protein [Gemmatimonadales bacterium]